MHWALTQLGGGQLPSHTLPQGWTLQVATGDWAGPDRDSAPQHQPFCPLSGASRAGPDDRRIREQGAFPSSELSGVAPRHPDFLCALMNGTRAGSSQDQRSKEGARATLGLMSDGVQ